MKELIKKLLSITRKFFLSDSREISLSNYFSTLIKNNIHKESLKILDYGSGFNPDVIVKTSNNLSKQNIDCYVYCLDFYEKSEVNYLNSKFNNIEFYNFENEIDHYFDIVVISDVLHHIDPTQTNETNLIDVISMLSEKSDFILIKDHFEDSFITRTILRIMDFIGNYKDDVNIPKRYFTKKSFLKLINKTRLLEVDEIKNIKIYSKIFFPFTLSKIQFIKLFKIS